MSNAEIKRLQYEARQLSDSPAKVALLEQAVKIADSLNDTDKGVELRMELVSAAISSGVDDRALVAFAWCLAQSDKDNERFPENDFLWEYKWILGGITGFPTVSVQKIWEMEDDYEKRLSRNGYSLRPVYKLRSTIASDMGFLRRAREFETKWRKAPRDGMVDCRACEVDSEVRALLRKRKFSEVVRKAKPILNGSLRCQSVPQRTYGDVVIAQLSLGNLDEAHEAFAAGYPRLHNKHNLLLAISNHLCYLIRVLDVRRGLKLIERHLPWTFQANYPLDRMVFFAMTGCFFERLAAERPKPRKVRIPSALAVHRDDDKYAPAELAAWFQSEAALMAARYDHRNGNNYKSWELADLRALALGLERQAYVEPNESE